MLSSVKLDSLNAARSEEVPPLLQPACLDQVQQGRWEERGWEEGLSWVGVRDSVGWCTDQGGLVDGARMGAAKRYSFILVFCV